MAITTKEEWDRWFRLHNDSLMYWKNASPADSRGRERRHRKIKEAQKELNNLNQLAQTNGWEIPKLPSSFLSE